MAILKAFRGIRPVKDKVKSIASRPYDVLSSKEARIEADGNPYSFLHIVKPEIDLSPKPTTTLPRSIRKGKKISKDCLKREFSFRIPLITYMFTLKL